MNREKMPQLKGRVWKFGDNCDTGQIIPGRYVPLTDPHELATHLFEDVAPDFRKQIAPGDVVVAGRNFGCGSSREHAPKALKFAGVSAVVADAFARIFFRNALNIGLLAIPVPGISGETAAGDVLEIDVYQGQIVNLTRGRRHAFVPYDDFILEMIEAGGIVQQTIQMLKEGRLP